jgi:replicative DNA helicase
MHLYTSHSRQNPQETNYPQAVKVESLQDLLKVAANDHIFSQMKDNRRKAENFIQTDCLVLDLDNTHSEDPNDWKTIDDIADAFPEVRFYYVQSRNYMKPKTKGGRIQEPREKYHLYFPLSKPITNRDGARKALQAAGLVADSVHSTKDLLDAAAEKPEQPMYGVENPLGGEITGELCLDDYLRRDDVKAVWKKEIDKQVKAAGIEDLHGDELGWINSAEQRKSIAWLQEWAGKHGVELLGSYGIHSDPHKDAVAYPVQCPWCEDHTTASGAADSVIMVDRDGTLNYLCRHAHCARRTWKSYRQRAEALADFSQDNATMQESAEEYRRGSAGNIAADLFKDPICSTMPIDTGWPMLDGLLDGGLFPGLYTLGAVSSLGKTALALQMADQISAQGYDVLFFSLEMSKTELLARSLSRITAQIEAGSKGKAVGGITVADGVETGALVLAKTARQLLNPERRRNFGEDEDNLVEAAKETYADQAAHLWIIEGDAEGKPMSADEISQRIALHKEKTGRSPVVFVDYLQIMKSKDPHYTDLQRIDENVSGLRSAARKHGCPVIAILSYNRASYYGTVDISSGKGSGSTEYSSDVIFGLQPVGMDEGSNAAAQNKELMHRTKRQLVRNVELKILKNRLGPSDCSVVFKYSALFNTFEEAGEGIPIRSKKKKASEESRARSDQRQRTAERIADALELIARQNEQPPFTDPLEDF